MERTSDERSDAALAKHWLEMVGRDAVASEIESIYTDTMREITDRQPVCEASGRCCRFEQMGHRLYVTGIEVAYTVSILAMLDLGEGRDTPHTDTSATPGMERSMSISLPVLSGATLQRAADDGGCPFQVENLCSVHTIKPLACRTFFCDTTATEWQHDLTERMHTRITRVHEAHGIAYRYGEWRSMLAMMLGR